MTDYKFYKTKTNDRWDTIAYKFYGDVFRTKELIEANPDISISPILDSNLTLIIPVLEKTSTNSEALPVWKQ